MSNAPASFKVTRGTGAGGKSYEMVAVPHKLAAKAGGFRADAVDTTAIAARIAELGQNYPDMVRADVERLGSLWAQASAAAPDPEAEQELFRIAHDLSGQSATFGYGLASAIARGLRLLIEGGAARRAHTHPAVLAHIAALQQMLRDGVKGDGDEPGAQILASLHAAVVECARR
jgi:chemotaxis protein histidine kinase CheA